MATRSGVLNQRPPASAAPPVHRQVRVPQALRTILAALALRLAAPAGAGEFRLLRLDGLLVKWGAPRLGAGAEISYGFARAWQEFPGAVNCRTVAPLVAPAFGGDRRGLDGAAAAAFAMWSEKGDVRFRRAADDERPDILIGAQGEPEKIAFADVRHDPSTAAGTVAPIRHATICLNPQLPWRVRRGGSGFDLRTVLAHEIGHAIALDHPGPRGAQMGYRDQGAFDHLM